jgi:hypothetical protein
MFTLALPQGQPLPLYSDNPSHCALMGDPLRISIINLSLSVIERDPWAVYCLRHEQGYR